MEMINAKGQWLPVSLSKIVELSDQEAKAKEEAKKSAEKKEAQK